MIGDIDGLSKLTLIARRTLSLANWAHATMLELENGSNIDDDHVSKEYLQYELLKLKNAVTMLSDDTVDNKEIQI